MKKITTGCLMLVIALTVAAQNTGILFTQLRNSVQKDELSRFYITPKRIVWTSDSSGTSITGTFNLLRNGDSQPWFGIDKKALCRLINSKNSRPAILLDFGTELHGGIQLTTSSSNSIFPRMRITLGESVSEAMSNVSGNNEEKGGATNHHAMRDFEITVPGYGTIEIGNTGFRFVRIELTDTTVKEIALKEVRAVAVMRNIPYLGSFRCNDTLLNKVWETGAYTVHLCMQDYLIDGIKRDRMVWMGDMAPEILTINSVFGYNPVVPKSLDFARDRAPLPQWMNGLSSYSLWWILIQHNWYMYQGDRNYLKAQQTYLTALLKQLFSKVDSTGNVLFEGKSLFLDWPSSTNPKAIQAGMQALTVLSFDKGAELIQVLGDKTLAAKCRATADKMRKVVPDPNGSKQAAALMALAGIIPAEKANREVIAVGGAKNFSAFMGCYMLQTKALAGDYQGALDNIRAYWGGMIQLGATTFWEDFDLKWTNNGAGITEIVPPGKKDIHKDFGAYCYKNLRHSLCHGWSTGPTSWLSQQVLGVTAIEPGCKVVKIEPHLGDLNWAEGTFPTPDGLIKIRHDKQADGSVKSKIEAPKGVKVIRK
ncbi:MAG: alpha-L-rhamnosidase C-terminal domain-containing protein [Paludibacter sp.]